MQGDDINFEQDELKMQLFDINTSEMDDTYNRALKLIPKKRK